VRFVQQTRARWSWASLRQTETRRASTTANGEPRDEASPEP
jgi:hypothetical protein